MLEKIERPTIEEERAYIEKVRARERIEEKRRVIRESLFSIFDVLIVKETDGLIKLYINRYSLEEYGFGKELEVDREGSYLIIKTPKEPELFRERRINLYEVTDENLEQVACYMNTKDDLLVDISQYLDCNLLGYRKLEERIHSDGSYSLRLKLTEEDSDLNREAFLIDRQLYRNHR